MALSSRGVRHAGPAARAAALLVLCALIGAVPARPAGAQTGGADKQATIAALERSFREFLAVYRPKVKQRDRAFLARVHPNLPEEMYDFFFDLSIDMMRFSDETGLTPEVACREYNVCKVVYTQPNDSWAAQTFIFHDGRWRWLDQ